MNAAAHDCKTARLHRIGAIQPHGSLLAVDRGGICVAASANIMRSIGESADNYIGRDLMNLDRAADLMALVDRAYQVQEGSHLQSRLIIGDSVWQGLAHPSGRTVLLELQHDDETAPPTGRSSNNADRVAFVQNLQATDDPGTCAERLLDVVFELGGFDRTMLYQFSPDWHGEVLAEHLTGRLGGFMGLRFPADDIPPNARDLYVRNPVRMIPDATAKQIPVVRMHDDTPVDLTYSRLRAVHPVHLEYLGNMGVAASFSLSIVCNGVLWGMITCHHTTARTLPLSLQSELEEYLAISAMRISALLDRAAMDRHRDVEHAFAHLRERVNHVDQRHLNTGTFEMTDDLLATFDADGCRIQLCGQIHKGGDTPPDEPAAALLHWFRERRTQACDCFSELPEPLREHEVLKRLASGALFMPLMRDDYILLTRTEQIEKVQWAGRIESAPGPEAPLSPRRSFAHWEEVVQFHSAPWPSDVQQEAATFRAELNDLLTTAHYAGLAFTDTLTGLANRARLYDFLEDSVDTAKRSDSLLAVYFLDLNGFKLVNDRLGHQVGDKLLSIVARRLERLMRESDLLARLGGDEFIIVQKGLAKPGDVDAVIRRILWALEQPVSIAGENINVGVSVGVALCPRDAQDADGLLHHADAAMYQHKGSSSKTT